MENVSAGVGVRSFKGIKGGGILHIGASIVVMGARDQGFVKRKAFFGFWRIIVGFEQIVVVR